MAIARARLAGPSFFLASLLSLSSLLTLSSLAACGPSSHAAPLSPADQAALTAVTKKTPLPALTLDFFHHDPTDLADVPPPPPRPRPVIQAEVTKNETAWASEPHDAPASDRATLAHRIGDDLLELDRTLDDDAERELRSATLAKADEYIRIAIQMAPKDPTLAVPLFELARAYERANDPKARKRFSELVATYPDSQYMPLACLALGESFFAEAAFDSDKWDLAIQAYKQVLAFPPSRSGVYGYAAYKMGHAFWAKNDLPSALDAYGKAIHYSLEYALARHAAEVLDASRQDVVVLYALQGDPATAYAKLHGVAGDQGQARVETVKLVDALGHLYVRSRRLTQAIAVYADLVTNDEPGSCRWHDYTEVLKQAAGEQARITVEELEQVGSECPGIR